MEPLREIEPLSYTKRRRTFFFLLCLFVISLPFLYLYATGYRFDPSDPNAIVSTGGIYVAAERTGAEIYIDDELVRETRVFRTAFYAQNLEPRTHKVHVQKEGHHTWVKELPVTSQRVTEAQAFNLPVVPHLRVIAPYVSATGSQIVRTPLLYASTTNVITATTTKAARATSTWSLNTEYQSLLTFFTGTSTAESEARTLLRRIEDGIAGTSTESGDDSTTTRISGEVRLARDSLGDVYAQWIGSFEQMPYYYCASPFPRYSSSTSEQELPYFTPMEGKQVPALVPLVEEVGGKAGNAEFIHPLQKVDKNAPCDPRIRMAAPGMIRSFDFFPQSTDLVVLELEDGIYVSEIDPRSWQNMQPLVMGQNLRLLVENAAVYVYDGALIYQVVLES